MKLSFILFWAFAFLNFGMTPGDMPLAITNTPNCFITNTATGDSSRLHITNNSSLKRLPSILRDLSIALSQSTFQRNGFLSEKGFKIDLHDVSGRGYDTSATVTYLPGDTMYYLKLNRLNRQATDRALAVTLIHEIMHCILMDIDKRGRLGDEKAWCIIRRFEEKIKNPFGDIGNSFFSLMNRNDQGQHELMYQLFYQDMVLLLERFAQIHKPAFWCREDAELLMWSGLQASSGFQKLSFEEKKQIELSILKEKGIPVGILDY